MSTQKLGRYELVRVLGKGAMGLVYEGLDPNLHRRVAIKTIKVENLSAEEAAEYEVRFRTEAHSAARLQHPNIVSVYDSDRDADIAFLVMEFIEGNDLKHHLDKGTRYTLQQSVAIMGDLLSALDYAHRQNIVHRDIKPANLLIEPSGRVKLTDFGVARIQDSGEATRTQGTMVGTLKYMSPEQIHGHTVDSRSDLFAAGIVLYQLLTGLRPFDGKGDYDIIQQIVGKTPDPASVLNPGLPTEIDAVLTRALEKNRNDRYASAQEFLVALQAAANIAQDLTIAPSVKAVRVESAATWTSTVMKSESLLDTSAAGISSSALTQEVELVYWKEIKESEDQQDFEDYLGKFPTGIYADLARRRLKKLVALEGDSSSTGTRLVTRNMSDASAALTAPETPPLPVSDLSESNIARPTVDNPSEEPLPGPAPVPEVPDATGAPSLLTDKLRGTLKWTIPVAVLMVGGVVYKLVAVPADTPSPGALQSPTAQIAAALASAASNPASAAAASLAASAPAEAVAKLPAKKASKESTKPSSATAKPNTTVKSSEPMAAAPPKAADSLAPKVPSVASAVETQTANTDPKNACEGRWLIAYQMCLSEQCAKPVFVHHPVCVERKRQEEARKEADKHK